MARRGRRLMYNGQRSNLIRRRAGASALIASVEQLNISNSGVTATATIEEVDLSKSIIMYNGYNTSNQTDDMDNRSSYWKFDSTTQISVNRHSTASGSTDDTYLTAIQFPDDVVKNVTHGLLTQVSGKFVEGTPVDGADFNYSVPVYNGTSSVNAGEAPHTSKPRIEITDVSGEPKPTAHIGSNSTSANKYAFSIIEFQPDAIVSIDHFSITLNVGEFSDTHTIATTVIPENSMVFFSGVASDGVAFQPDNYHVALTLTDGDTATASRGDDQGTVTINATVVEFVSGVINSKQTLTTAPPGVAEFDVSISAVDLDKSFINFLGQELSEMARDLNPAYQHLRAKLKDETTVGVKQQIRTPLEGLPTLFYDVIESN